MIAFITRLASLAGVSLSPFWAGAVGATIIAAAGSTAVGVGSYKLYEAGRAAAESECQASALQAQIDAMQKDRDDARAAAADATLKLTAIRAHSAEEEQRTADYVAELEKRPAPACDLTAADLRGMRVTHPPKRATSATRKRSSSIARWLDGSRSGTAPQGR
jgi:hypothetical protein